MSNISNEQIYSTLLEIKQDVGGLLATVQSHQTVFAQHVRDDAAVAQDVTAIRLKLAKQAGASRVWNMVAAAAGSLVGAAAWFVARHG